MKSELRPVFDAVAATRVAAGTLILVATLLSASSGWVVELTGWFEFFLISTVVALPGLLLLVWMIRNLPSIH